MECVRALLQAGANALGTVTDTGGRVEQPGDASIEAVSPDGGETPPFAVYVTEKGLEDILALLLQHGADSPSVKRTKTGDTLLHLAARGGHVRCLQLLLRTIHHSVILSYNDAYETPATLAVTAGFYDCFLTLIADGGVEQMDGEGRNLLHLAALHGQLPMVERLLEEGYAVDETDFEGHTPLIDAILRGHLDIVELLVLYSEIDFPAETNRTALMFAAQTNAIDSLKVLLDAGADVNIRDKDGNTALILGVKHADILAMLLAHGAMINVQNKSGVTALWYAAYYGTIRSLHCLLKASSNPELTGEKSIFALEIALERGHFEAAKCIVYAGCPFRNIIYSLKKYTTLHVLNRGGIEFYFWVQDWLKNPRSLKYLAMNCARLAMGIDNISQRVSRLPLPKPLIKYIDLIDLCQFHEEEEFTN